MREIAHITKPSATPAGNVHLPGSKSIANRLLLLRHLYAPHVNIINLPEADDTSVLVKALSDMDHHRYHIDAGHAGTAFRFLTALCAASPGDWFLTGSARMLQRPIAPLVSALKQIGALIDYHDQPNYPPLQIRGKKLTGGRIVLDAGISSQFTSALCLIAPSLMTGLEIEFSKPPVSYAYVQMTLKMLKQFGALIHEGQHGILIKASSLHLPNTIETEGDWSAASYWYSICALTPGAEFVMPNLTLSGLQGDAVLPKLFHPLGVHTEYLANGVRIKWHGKIENELSINFSEYPDLAQTILVTCFGLGVKLTCTGISTLAHKETDRITAMVNEITALGGHIGADRDGIVLQPIKAQPSTYEIQTYQDHRMALSFAPLACVLPKISIADPSVVTKSYPMYWNHLKAVGFSVNLHA